MSSLCLHWPEPSGTFAVRNRIQTGSLSRRRDPGYGRSQKDQS
jgi:hypothetical protein